MSVDLVRVDTCDLQSVADAAKDLKKRYFFSVCCNVWLLVTGHCMCVRACVLFLGRPFSMAANVNDITGKLCLSLPERLKDTRSYVL